MANILIAEDEHDIRELLNFTLTFAGHSVTAARNGAEAVEFAPKVKPDLIMMDVRMPKMTGYEACRHIKAMEGMGHIPIVFLTAKGQDDEVAAGIEVGAAAYIIKPFIPDDLIRKVGEILKDSGSGTA